MTGALILELERIGNEQDGADADHWRGFEDGLGAFLRRMERSFDADAAAMTEAEEATQETAGEEEKAAILAAVKRGVPLCESPIEKLLLPWLVAQKYPGFHYRPRVLLPGEGALLEDRCVAVIPQLPIGRYRADFALAARHGSHLKFIIVEADGREFHESVEQMRRDVERDIALTNRLDVLEVVRFTGSEIYRAPKDCAASAAKVLYHCWQKDNVKFDHKFRGGRR